MAAPNTTVSLQTLIRGFDGAWARLEPLVAEIDSPLDDVFLPLFEAPRRLRI
jgi:hypothetical protein